MIDPITKFIMDHMLDATAEVLMPIMLVTFLVAVVLRSLVFYTARAESNFAKEFEKRVHRYFVDNPQDRIQSFYKLLKTILEKTYYETFELRNKYKRRNLDHITSLTDRLFLIQDASVRLIRDLLRQTRYFRRDANPPKMLDVTKGAFENNPIFNRLMGILPINLLNELLNILPNLFIIGGIFGTFLGISKGLPELGGMDLGHVEQTKAIMDAFLVKISQAMVKSIVGIALSVAMSLINTVLAPEGLYYQMINRFSGALDQLWNETSNNEIDHNDLIIESPNAGNGGTKDKRLIKPDKSSGPDDASGGKAA